MWEKRGNEVQTDVVGGERKKVVAVVVGAVVCVWCVKISVQVRGEVCVRRPVCICRRVGFRTSHLSHIPTCHHG